MPNIPNITPVISLERCEVVNMLLSSIALEEIGLSHILNAEGEKLQAMIAQKPECLESYFAMNDNVNRTLRTIVKSQMLLQMKLEDVVGIDCSHCCNEKEKEKCKKKCAGCNKLDCSCQSFNPCN